MSQQPSVDLVPHLATVATAMTAEGQPQSTFAALEAAFATVLGHKLFTVLLHHAASGESERFYTNQPEAYPVGGRKTLNQTFWSDRVLRGKQAYIGYTAEDIESVFFDHALIASLGCASVLNLPVVFDGRILGTINLLHEARWYDEADVAPGLLLAALAVPAYLTVLGAGTAR